MSTNQEISSRPLGPCDFEGESDLIFRDRRELDLKHILGMAKSNTDLKGAKAPKLELDYLRLAYAVKDLCEKGQDAIGYLLVMNADIARRAKVWAEKYESRGSVEILVADLSKRDLELKDAESAANARSQAAVALGAQYSGGSTAEIGRRLAEDALERIIEVREPGVKRRFDASGYPMKIAWDYYGTL